MGQWNRIESSEISPQLYDQWIFNSGAKIIQLGGAGCGILFSVSIAGMTRYPHAKE